VTSFFRGNIAIGMAEIVFRLPLVFTVGYLARSVGTEVYGNWALVLAFQVFVVGVAGLGLSSSLSRFVPASNSEQAAGSLRFAWIATLAPLALLGALAVLFRAPIGQVLGVKADLCWLVPLAALLATGSVTDGLLDAYFKARITVGRQVAFVVSRTVVEVFAVGWVFVLTPPFLDGPVSLLTAYVATVVVAKMLIYPWILTGMGKGRLLPDQIRRRELLLYGLPMVPGVLAVWLVSQSDRLVLSHFVSKAELGVYAFGASLAAYMVFLGYAVYPLLLPVASRFHDEGNKAAVRALFDDAQSIFILLWGGAMVCLAFWSNELIAWTAGHTFAGAASVFLILCFASGLEQLMGIYQYVFHLVKRTDLILWLNLAYAVTMIAALAAAAAIGGISWAPWAVLGAALIFNVVRYAVAIRHLFIPVDYVLPAKIMAIAILTFVIARYSSDWNAPSRAALTVVVALSFLGYLLKRKPSSAASAVWT
jgi:O-antigen/teichoic acid export membrane protein